MQPAITKFKRASRFLREARGSCHRTQSSANSQEHHGTGSEELGRVSTRYFLQ